MKPVRGVHLTVLNRNLGDNALNLAIRRMLRPHVQLDHMELLGNDFGPATLRRLMESPLIVFGGGGLIHSFGPSGKPWSRTGTMWNMELADIARLPGRIVLYGVGFNHFHGDPPPLPQMEEFLHLLAEKKALVAFRNDGSLARLLEHFPSLADKGFVEVPDPGTFYRVFRYRRWRPYFVVQVAADRPHLRHPGRDAEFFTLLRRLCHEAGMDGFLIPHTIDDAKLYERLDLGSRVQRLALWRHWRWTWRTFMHYAGADFTISTRGHSQICSVGNGTPTFSIATHPKITGFARACGVEEWCHDFAAEGATGAVERFADFLSQRDAIRRRLHDLNVRFDAEIAEFNARILSGI
ncbi:MAG: polysaccharide pyruvyl transferase family protein [Candidatus Sumerlaeia bacterium]|nr:polysaccharide pyruvyl transferase family protein [Candidatus Sumerlaeia bacterium]